MKIRVAIVFLAAALIAAAGVSLTAMQERASAQGAIPELRTIILQGFVSINGELSPNGYQLTAKIRNSAGDIAYVSSPTTVGRTVDSRYTALVVGPFPAGEGREIEFWLDDQVKATTTTIFAPMQNGRPCLGCSWTLPILLPLALDFPRLPIATPTPIPTATPTVVILQPSSYSGQILAGDSIPADGTPIYATVGDYQTASATITNGRYRLVINPVAERYLGAPVFFFIGEVRAVQSAQFVGGEFLDPFNLIFPNLPPTPTPTPVPPTATPTPEPTRTPTPVPVPTATATPTVTPTPIVELTATATATPVPEESSGGVCSANSGGPSSLGMIGFLALPFGLFAARRLRSLESRTPGRGRKDED